MTRLLEQAIDRLRQLPESEQDAAADAVFAHLSHDPEQVRLSAEQAAEVERIRQDLRAGSTRLATDQEMTALWKKCGL